MIQIKNHDIVNFVQKLIILFIMCNTFFDLVLGKLYFQSKIDILYILCISCTSCIFADCFAQICSALQDIINTQS